MSAWWSLWRMEWRRQRLDLGLLTVGTALFAVPACSGMVPVSWVMSLKILSLVVLSIGGILLSLDVFCRDLQTGTADVYFELPVAPWRVFLTKYLFSVLWLTAAVLIGIVLVAWVGEEKIKRESAWLFLAMRVLWLWLIVVWIHALLSCCCVALRGFRGVAVALFVLPVLAVLGLPALAWGWRIGIACYTVVLVVTAGTLWCRSIGYARPVWRVALKCFAGIAALAVLLPIVLFAIQSTRYLKMLDRFEHMPGLEIPRGTVAVPRAVWNMTGKTADLPSVDWADRVEIPVAKYAAYRERERQFLSAVIQRFWLAVKEKNDEKALALMAVGCGAPDVIVPLGWAFNQSFSCSEIFGGGLGFGSPFGLGAAEGGSSLFVSPLRQWVIGVGGKWYPPFPETPEGVPLLDGVIAQLQIQAMRPFPPIRLLPSYTYGLNLGLRDALPGVEQHGMARVLAVWRWYGCLILHGIGETVATGRIPAALRDGYLYPTRRTMMIWMELAQMREQLRNAPEKQQWAIFFDWYRKTKKVENVYLHDTCVQLMQPVLVRKKLLPLVRIRRFMAAHGRFPRTAEEIPGWKPGMVYQCLKSKNPSVRFGDETWYVPILRKEENK